jgi:methyltransferase OMS1
MAAFLTPGRVLGGLLIYGTGTVAAYLYFAKPKEFPRPAEADRRGTFDSNARHYDADVDKHEKLSGIDNLRKELLTHTSGRVCEVAAGTGRNVAFYPTSVTSVTLTDFAPQMLHQAQLKVQALESAQAAKFSMLPADAKALPLENDSFDCVVETFSLCSFEDPEGTLREMGRLVKPGGKLLLLEHGRSSYSWVNTFLDKHTPGHVHKHGCFWNRDIDTIVKSSVPAFRIVDTKRKHFGTTYMYVCEKLQ